MKLLGGFKMENSVKILLIVCVILVACLSLTIGLFLGNQMIKPQNASNHTNTSNPVNTTNNSNNATVQEPTSYISETKASGIALTSVSSHTSDHMNIDDVTFINDGSNPYYRVELSDSNYSQNSNKPYAYLYSIDAHTGNIIKVTSSGPPTD